MNNKSLLTLNNDIKSSPLNPSLQAKLQLLQHIKKGNYQKILSLSYAISKVGRSNNQVYNKMANFVHQHKQQLIQMEQNQKDNEEVVIENVDDTFVQGKQWNTDDEADYSDTSSEDNQKDFEEKENVKITIKDNKKNQFQPKRQLFKELSCSKNNRTGSKKKNIVTGKVEVNSSSQCCQKSKSTNLQTKKLQQQPQHKNSAIQKSKIRKV